MSWALTRPARSPAGVYYEVAASPRGDLLLWLSETGPATWFSGNVGALGIVSLLVNKLFYRGRWQVVVRQSPASRATGPGLGVLWRTRNVRKRAVEDLMAELTQRIEAGSFRPDDEGDGTRDATAPEPTDAS